MPPGASANGVFRRGPWAIWVTRRVRRTVLPRRRSWSLWWMRKPAEITDVQVTGTGDAVQLAATMQAPGLLTALCGRELRREWSWNSRGRSSLVRSR